MAVPAGRAGCRSGAANDAKSAGAKLTETAGASEELLAGAREGTVVEFRSAGLDDFDALNGSADWGPDRQISADFLLDVLTGRTVVQTHSRGVRIRGARVVGDLQWDWQRLPVPLELEDCVIDSPINLDHAQVAGLSLIRCRLPGLSAEQMTSASTLKLVGSRISGTVKLRDAVINGAVLASGAQIRGGFEQFARNDVRVAVLATRIQVTGALVMDGGFSAEGATLLPGARIGGNLYCATGRFHQPGGDAMQAQDAEIAGTVVLTNGFAAQGKVQFDRARISGDFDCAGARLDGGTGIAFSAARMEIGGGLFLRRGFTAHGPVHLFGAQIGGSWDCGGGSFTNPTGGETIWASGARIQGSVYFERGFTSLGSIRMRGAQIIGNLSGCGGRFSNPGQVAFRAVNLTVEGDLLLDRAADGSTFVAEGEVSFVGARIGGLVNARFASFANPGALALSFGEAEIAGNVLLANEFTADGEVRLRGARIGGSLNCSGGQFSNPATRADPGAFAMSLVGMDITGSLLLNRGFRADGQVRINRSRIGGMFDGVGGEFHNPGGFCIFARAIRVGAGVLFSTGFVAKGSVRLTAAQITGDLNCSGGVFTEDFHAAGSVVSGSFRWRLMPAPPAGRVDLRRVKVSELDDDLASWPSGGRLWLAGFGYDRLSDRAPRSPSDRIEWIRRQHGYTPEPYQQLAEVYRSNGQISEATSVSMAQQDDLIAPGDLTRPARTWAWFLGRSIGHGYRPGRAAWALLLLYVLTLGSVFLGAQADGFIQVGETAPQPTVTATRCDDSYPCLSVPAYALENITPIINLHQTENWQPKSSTAAQWLLRDWLYLTTVIGYAGTTLLAAALSGLARSA